MHPALAPNIPKVLSNFENNQKSQKEDGKMGIVESGVGWEGWQTIGLNFSYCQRII